MRFIKQLLTMGRFIQSANPSVHCDGVSGLYDARCIGLLIAGFLGPAGLAHAAAGGLPVDAVADAATVAAPADAAIVESEPSDESPQGDPSLEFIVQADLLDGRSREQDPHCALAISANHINGQFVALVYKVSPASAEHGVQGLFKISPGTVDWTNGIESFIEPDLAWLEAATRSTEALGVVLSEPYARVHERKLEGESVTALYDAMLEGPVTVFVDSAGIPSVYPLKVPFVPEVVLRARACADDLLSDNAQRAD